MYIHVCVYVYTYRLGLNISIYIYIHIYLAAMHAHFFRKRAKLRVCEGYIAACRQLWSARPCPSLLPGEHQTLLAISGFNGKLLHPSIWQGLFQHHSLHIGL